jgi:hypothetical protein
MARRGTGLRFVLGIAKALDKSIKESNREALRIAKENQRHIARQIKESERQFKEIEKDQIQKAKLLAKQQEQAKKSLVMQAEQKAKIEAIKLLEDEKLLNRQQKDALKKQLQTEKELLEKEALESALAFDKRCQERKNLRLTIIRTTHH